MIICLGDMGVGTMYPPDTCGVDEGVGVGTTAPLEELQAGAINNPNKQLNRNSNFFFMSCHQFSIVPS
jgi:hypothetical protein